MSDPASQQVPHLLVKALPEVIHDCSGYTCSHGLCRAEVEARVENLSRRPKRTSQPWEIRQS